MLIRRITELFIAWSLSGAALGQTQPPAPPDDPRKEKADDARVVRTGRMGGNDPGQVVEKMKSELKLDETQAAELSRLVTEHQKTIADLRAQMRIAPEVAQKMKELRERMKKAQDANDQAGMKSASDEMQAARKESSDRIAPVREQMTKLQDELRDKFKAVLREDQRGGFDQIWEESMSAGTGRRSLRANPRLLRATVDRLPDLTADQKRQLTDLYRQYDEAAKGLKGGAMDAQNQKLHDSVMNILTPEQREKVQERLNGRPERGRRGPNENAPPPKPPEKTGP